MRKAFLLGVFILTSTVVFGQQPRIDKIEQIIAFPSTTVQITGIGFNTIVADLEVWFGSVRGSIITASSTSITVTVPPGARLSNVEVINKPPAPITPASPNGFSAKSEKKFMPNFSGVQPFTDDFEETTITTPAVTLNDPIFDLCSCDFNRDGLPDVVGSKKDDGQSGIKLLRNTSTIGTVSFVQTNISPAFINPTFSVSCGDLNGDGKPDLVASRGGNTTGSNIFIFQNTSPDGGALSFAAPIQLNLAIGDFAKKVAIHDLNKDGRPEIVVTNGQTNTIYIFENKLTSTTISAAEFTRIDKVISDPSVASGTLPLEIADLDNDGWPEIILVPNNNGVKFLILTNPANGTLVFSTLTSFALTGLIDISDIAVADFDHDSNGLLDIVVADLSAGGGKAFVYLNKGSLFFQSVNGTIGFLAPKAFGVDVADMNGDGYADFVIADLINTTASAAANEINIFINDKATTPTFAKKTLTSSRANWFAKAADFDGDAKPDIVVTSVKSTNSSIDLWINKNCHLPVILNEDPISICGGQTKTLKAVELPGITYSWSTGDTGPSTVINVSHVPTVTLTASGESGCAPSQVAITLEDGGVATLPADPIVITQPDGVCSGSGLTLVTTSTAAGATYLWTGPNGYTASTAAPNVTVTPSATVSDAGDYYLQVKVGNCTTNPSLPKSISVSSPNSFLITRVEGSNVCEGQPALLSVAASTTDYDFQWKRDGNNVGTNSNSYPISSASNATDEGSYTVLIEQKPPIVCTSTTDPFALVVFTAPVASFTRTPTLVCVGTEVTFDAAGSTLDNTAPTPVYAWAFGDATSGTGISVQHTYAAAQSNVSASLTLSYTGLTGCSNTSTPPTFDVNAAIAPTITASPSVTEICGDGTETVLLNVNGTYTTYAWTPTAPNTASLSITAPGTYSVVTTDASGCTGNVDIILTPKAGCETGVVGIPKVFTPNGDNANDLLIITGIPNVDACSFNVFDGRGRRVFEVKGFPVTGWDGTSNGKALPDGTYYYVMGCPGKKPLTGSILIVR